LRVQKFDVLAASGRIKRWIGRWHRATHQTIQRTKLQLGILIRARNDAPKSVKLKPDRDPSSPKSYVG
jgi:hypothetical protein